MTPDDVRAAAERLVQFHERFAPLFGKEQAQVHAFDYVKGLMVCPDRKSIEPIALLVGHGDVSGLQKFVNSAPWGYDDVQAEVQAVFDDDLVPSAAGSPAGVVGIIDELWDAGAQGVILGCTELELLVKQADSELPVFPCTTLHVEAALDRALA